MILASEFEYLVWHSKELNILSGRGIILVNDSGIFDIRGGKCEHINLNDLFHLVSHIET
jgi:hypothetical protein